MEMALCECSINYYYHSSVFHIPLKALSPDMNEMRCKSSLTCIFYSPLHPLLHSMNECTNESSSLTHDQLF